MDKLRFELRTLAWHVYPYNVKINISTMRYHFLSLSICLSKRKALQTCARDDVIFDRVRLISDLKFRQSKPRPLNTNQPRASRFAPLTIYM